MKISIIIPTYNRAKHIGTTIQSFLALNYHKENYEIIIANNNSTDNTEEVVRQFIDNPKGVSVTYLFEPRQGVHYARNKAAKLAKFELLYFTDDDMVADENLLLEIIKPFIFNPKVGTATGRVLPKWEVDPPQWILNHFANQYLSLLDPPELFLITHKIGFLYSCHQIIRKDVFFEAEGFNPEFTNGKYLGDGETGLNIKVAQMNYLFGYNAMSVIYHSIPASRMTQKYINRRFANGAVAHSYSKYRATNPSSARLILEMIVRLFFIFPVKIIIVLVKCLKNTDLTILHYIPGYISYYFQRFIYDFQILTNKKLRRFILKSDWLTNDSFV